MKTTIVLASLALGLGLVTFACSDDHTDGHSHGSTGGHTSEFPSCQAIIDKCHELDVGEGPIHDCHDFAHDEGATEASCAAKKAECEKACVPENVDAGNTGDAAVD